MSLFYGLQSYVFFFDMAKKRFVLLAFLCFFIEKMIKCFSVPVFFPNFAP